jgi:DNA-binding response OmpR family regulator
MTFPAGGAGREQGLRELTAIAQGQPGPNEPSATIVVVDDSSTIRVFFERVTRDLDVRLYTFGSVAESLPCLAEIKPDLLFLDILMPDKDGLTFLQELRNRADHATTPVVVITSKDYAQDRALARSLGVLEYVTKPMSTLAIRELILRLLPATAASLPAAGDSAAGRA